ncbi:DUF969 domain-containing protein [Treponema denticola]|jgi:putative membrane protein|uniref:DUF969 domain-containing protein n=2 Tax=Treponema denticola TaxID=158 RepID=A0A0F6MPZ0_TREDN|nr:DUF969 domain-containing protein [Treponema denticola]EMB21574.1 hypothetical protein HMPREF9723_01347 [Treponema denticola OTK]EMB33237.1 hypothetical protein HMPREF9726_01598 [Treponema denticola H-22]EMB44945.1 hypothetical protein HMPREF9730_01460 [Treponema denticola AL-2]UTC98920.1 DUF969 domain-containing protein [Treponema denticola]UTY27225.1 DUF969 domain-containing protein [Treponema denticola]
MNYLVLIGVAIIIAGFILKLDVVAVVLISGLVTGLIAKMGFVEVLNAIGTGFVNNRYMSLFFISFPVIAIMERYGLKERAADFIKKIKGASAGMVIWLYILIRTIASAFSIRLGGHVQFIRPLILPMAEGAAQKHVKLTEDDIEKIKGLAGASENYGNFFGQNIFPVASGVLLITGTLKEQGLDITNTDVAKYSIFAGVAMVLIALVQCWLFEKSLRKGEKADV